MPKLKPTKDNRTTYDKKTGAVRSFFGAELVDHKPEDMREEPPTVKSNRFLEVNSEHFKLSRITYRNPKESHGAASMSVSYEQAHCGIPVYRAQLVVGMRKADGAVTSTINAMDYDIPADLTRDTATVSHEQAVAAVRARIGPLFATLEREPPTPILYVYRHTEDETVELGPYLPKIRLTMLNLSTGTPGQVYLVWQVLIRTREPNGSWEVLVDATNRELVSVKDRLLYAPPNASIFWPDPIRSTENSKLSWDTDERILDQQLVKVPIRNLDQQPVNGMYNLEGICVKCREREGLPFSPPATAGDFDYGAMSQEFLSVMAYYWLDRLITDVRSYGFSDFNKETQTPIEVDAQGYSCTSTSHFNGGANPPYIALATNTEGSGSPRVPDAQDPGVIVHEYGHAIHHFMGKPQSWAREHWFCDFLAVAWVDRYNENQYMREEMFPWNNNKGNEWSKFRRVDLAEKFNDANFACYEIMLRGAIGATALWDWFKSIGGDSSDADVRKWAADEAIGTYMDMLDSATEFACSEDLANGLITADEKRTGGLYKKVIWDAFRRRGLWTDFTQLGNVDLYVRSSGTDTGEYASRPTGGTSPDIWVRNNPPANYGENPDDGHQDPINNVPNYIYVRVHNRGSQDAAANVFSVELFHCSPSTAMLWPTDFQSQSLGALAITTAVPANGGSVRMGPYEWTPQILGQECLLAVVKGLSDPSIADEIKAKGSVDHVKLVRFDNNVGQRNVKPATPA